MVDYLQMYDARLSKLRALRLQAAQMASSARIRENLPEFRKVERARLVEVQLEIHLTTIKIQEMEVQREPLRRQLEEQQSALKHQMDQLPSNTFSPLRILKHWSREQAMLRETMAKARKTIADLRDTIAELEKNLLRIDSNSSALSKERFNHSETAREISEHLAALDASDPEKFERENREQWHKEQILTAEIEPMAIKIDSINRVVQPLLARYDRLHLDRKDAFAVIKKAKEFDRALSNARSSENRAELHRQCERELGSGRPNQLIWQCLKKIPRIERELTQLENRICAELSRCI